MKLAAIISLAVGITAAPFVHAGERVKNEVFIDSFSRYASGAMVDARASSDSNQLVRCDLVSANFATCTFRNAINNGAQCFTTNPSLINTIHNIDSSSFVAIGWDLAGSCTNITVVKSSSFRPLSISGN